MAQAARKLEADWKTEEQLSPFDESFARYLESEACQAEAETISTRQRALRILAEKGWKPKVEGKMRGQVDEIRRKYDRLSEEEQVAYAADMEAHHPDLFQAIQDSFEDDDVICGAACELIDKELSPRLAAFEQTQALIGSASDNMIRESTAEIADALKRNPAVLRIVPIDTEGVEVPDDEDMKVAVGQ